MPFVKGDPNINRNGRPKNAEKELLRDAISKVGIERGEDFWEKVAKFAFTDKNVMIAVVKKFIPDLEKNELSGIPQTQVNVFPNKTIVFKDIGPDEYNRNRSADVEQSPEDNRIKESV